MAKSEKEIDWTSEARHAVLHITQKDSHRYCLTEYGEQCIDCIEMVFALQARAYRAGQKDKEE